MAGIYKNVATGTTTLITKKGGVSGNIKKILIANVDGHQADNVCLFLEDETASTSTDAGNVKYHFIKDVDIPYASTLVLEDCLSFDSKLYHLRITTQNASDGGAANLTIIIK